MDFRSHGGYCCGIFHILGMGSRPSDENLPTWNTRGLAPARGWTGERALRSAKTYLLPEGNAGRVLEVTTTSEDRQTENWTETLLREGFKKVSSFLNSNSGNTVTVWHYHPDLTVYGDVPQAREEVRPVLVEYCPNFRLKGRGAMFSAPEEVREMYPLIRQIDRRTVFSDGTVTWEENV